MRRFRCSAPDAAVLIVTGYSDLQGAIAALRQGASDYILKPINPEALRASLFRIADRRRLALERSRSEAASSSSSSLGKTRRGLRAFGRSMSVANRR